MARYHPDRNTQPIFDAAAHWRRQALESQGSVFLNQSVWSDANIALLREYFVEHPDLGEGTFIEKLQRQLAPADLGASFLAAEMTWVMLLCPSNISPRNKRDTVQTIWSWAQIRIVDDSPWLTDAVFAGIGSSGTAFNTARWRELRFFVSFIEGFRALRHTTAQELLADGWKFAEWIGTVPDANSRQLRHMILYLLFPEEFERVFGRSDRRRILHAFTGLSESSIARMPPLEIDRRLREVRRAQEDHYETGDLDFYRPPLSEMWKRDEEPTVQAAAEEEESEFSALAATMQRQHVLRAIKEIDKSGYPNDARSTVYDLIQGVNRYPPKYVFSLAAKESTGKELPRAHFTGGESSQCFKVLRDLRFSIERKDFVPDLLGKFLKQADRATDLSVADFPKSYRGLHLNISFGKGALAKIPSISFTAFGQTTSNGIYPALLYYHRETRLVVAYCISETNTPKSSWNRAVQARTIAQAFEQLDLQRPQRYASSYIHSVFDLSEQVDEAGIQQALDEVIAHYYERFEGPDPISQEEPAGSEPLAKAYSVEEALVGLFIDEPTFRSMLSLLRSKRNIILQGPPGVGKTFIYERLAFALMGEEAKSRAPVVQFHPSYSYEDFIQGFRPSGSGFVLKSGPFFDICQWARDNPANRYVLIIDEINRGNLAKIFGDTMALIERDKRGPRWITRLTYAGTANDTFYVPENVYLIGLMNTADRSLAMMDYALRRRFGFVDLEPQFHSEKFRDYLESKGVDGSLIDIIIARMGTLNLHIAEGGPNLGPGYCIGHSFFCGIPEEVVPDWAWYKQVIETEIKPLLREYYFDDLPHAADLVKQLLKHD